MLSGSMRYLDLKTQFEHKIIFSLTDIRKIEPGFHRTRLSEWQAKGYIRKIAREYYLFADASIEERVLFLIANRIYKPSYISLETGLRYYNLIPESVYQITSVSSKKTQEFASDIASFSYNTIKPELMFGYNLIEHRGQKIKIGEREKVLLDYLYLNPQIDSEEAVAELRLNQQELEAINMEKLSKYREIFDNKALNHRLKTLQKHHNLSI